MTISLECPDKPSSPAAGPPQLSVVNQPIANLHAYRGNARIHSKRQIRQIADSITAFGFTNPILVDRHNTIIAGHGRWRAAQLLRITMVPTIFLENLTEDQVRAYILADNRLAEKAGWDKSILAIELKYLLEIDLGFELTVTGFEDAEIDLTIQEGSETGTEAEILEPVPPGPAVTQPGDLWQFDKHRIFCGNSRDQESFQKLMSGRMADVVFIDPPYNVPIDGHVSGNGSIQHREFQMAAGEMTAEEFTRFLTDALELLVRHSKINAVNFVCMDWRHMGELLTAGRKCYDTLLNLCIWTKDIRVHYCAEQFENDGSMSSSVLKTLQRSMAAEYSSELSIKVFSGQCRLIEPGFRQGGAAGYGLRRQLIDRNQAPKGLLGRGERKSLQTDRVILVQGPQEEIEVVQKIYTRFEIASFYTFILNELQPYYRRLWF
jgi:hypothetical protein